MKKLPTIVGLLVGALLAACGASKEQVRREGSDATAAYTATTSEVVIAQQARARRAALSSSARLRLSYLYQEAVRQKMAGNHVEAMDLLRHCREICPDAAEVLYDLGLYHLMLREDSTGLQLLSRAAAIDPQNTHYRETIASYYLQRGSSEKALPQLEELARLQPRRTDILGQLVRLYTAQERPADAVRVLDRIELLDGKTASVSYEKFGLYRQLGQEKKAFEELESLCREYPHEMSYRLAIGNQFLEAGRVEEARKVYDQVRRVEPANENLQLSMLQLYRKTGADSLFAHVRDSLLFAANTGGQVRVTLLRDYISSAMRADSAGREHVEHVFEELDRHFPADLDLLQLRAAYLATYDKSNDSAFVAVMDRVIDLEPDNTQALFYLIQFYGEHHDFPRLENLCRRGVLTHPDELICHYYLGVACYQQDKKAEALQAFREGIVHKSDESRPAMVADLYAVMGDLLHEMEREAEAYAAYDSCLTYQADNAGCLNNYAYYLSLKGKNLDKAEEMSYRTIRLEPDNKTYLDTYAWILFMKGRYAEAQMYIDRVCPPDSTDSVLLADKHVAGVVLEHAGDIAALNGKTEQAVRFWQLARKAGGSGLTALLPRKIRLKKYIKDE